MYAFKVFVSTLICLIIVLMCWSFVKSKDQSPKIVAFSLMIVNALSLVAIWG